MTDAKWLDLRQKLSRVHRKSAQLMEDLREAKTEPWDAESGGKPR